MPFTSSSICREDIQLLRALANVPSVDGFYIDVGANDPHVHSVTKLFYERGWRGINLEPSPFWFNRLENERPRDINIQAAASDRTGAIILFDHPAGGLGTIVERYADEHEKSLAIPKTPLEVKAVTLREVCEQYAPETVHFMKIDVEGHEKEAVAGMDFSRFRPWIICIESTEPLTADRFTHGEWEPMLLAAGYNYVRFDSLNRWYVAQERRELEIYFQFGVDDYVIDHELNIIAASASKISAYERFRGGGIDNPLALRLSADGRLADCVSCFLNDRVGFTQNHIEGQRFLRTMVGAAGHVIYGPYLYLDAGSYRIGFDVRAVGDPPGEQPVAVLDASTAAGTKILAAKSILSSDLGREAALQLEFAIAATACLEFRVFTAGVASLLVCENVGIEKLPERPKSASRLRDRFDPRVRRPR